MDTKWKNRGVMLLWLVLFTYGLSGVLTALVNNNDYLKPSYFKTSQYEESVGALVSYLQAYEFSYQPKEDVIKKLTVSNEEIEEYRYRYGELTDQIQSIKDQYQYKVEEARASGNEDIANVYIKERDTKIEDITKNFESDDYVEEKIIKEKEKRVDEYYKELEGYRKDYKVYNEAFAYYLKNTSTGEIYTNLPSESIKSAFTKEKMLYVNSYPTDDVNYLGVREESIIYGYEDVLPDVDTNVLYEGKIGLRKDVSNANAIMASYHNFNDHRIVFWIYSIGAIISLIISGIMAWKMAIFQRIKSHRVKNYYDRLPIDVALGLFGISAIISLLLIDEFPHYYNYFSFRDLLYRFFMMVFFLGVTIVQWIYLFPLIKELPLKKGVLKRSISYQLLKMIRDAFANRRVGTQVFLVLAIVFMYGLGAAVVVIEPSFLIIYFPAFVVVALPIFFFMIRRIGYYNEITRHASALTKGKFESDLKVVGKTSLSTLASDINQLKHGVKTSQKAQVKSERLKTELITNVSHDLRTPLTSIITYSELLKNAELTNDERSTYIEIIDRKSKRLKVLIDDLFEASKMASGNIELSKAKVDVVQLLQQALAEYNETIQASTVQFRVTNPDNPLFAYIDGQKLWRVFENLIGNILKYSLENTRAYLAIKREKQQIIITFKNVSKYELSEDVNELFERFKRGDESRHTEGSGLGLAIAKSIIDLHEGQLDIDVDGDLFKVTIILDALDS
ncbi:sensor histidine kinase [Metabacillus halosaccharovorans]|uniref:sensor histidine kinase n=1 Tax=Metabacillus halosaccharovorans TaxID=930124 RepID=UPI000995BF5B|nr:HAMP domain-containing sensor histidine kinase [Metabacillus halosaccharovorans]